MVQGSNLLEAAQKGHEGLVQQFLRADSQSVAGRGGTDLSRTMPAPCHHASLGQPCEDSTGLPGPCGNRNNLRLKMGWVNWVNTK